ncbi:MAG: hypothetical protein Q9208_007567 [Pyrenodesmia sp. 3 TL-2023]
MKTFEVGEKFEIWLFDPDTTDLEVQDYKKLPQWQAEIIPQLADIKTPGNITFLKRQPPGNNTFDQLVTNKTIKEIGMKSHAVYFVPRVKKATSSADLLRILQGKTPKQSHKPRFFDKVTPREVTRLKNDQHHPVQQIAYDQLMQTEMVAFILGPPGSDNSFFLTDLNQVIAAVGKPLIVTCPSNAAVDALAKKLYEADPTLAAMRFHSLHFESAVRDMEIRKQQAEPRRKAG